jgi:glycosyltransferase involved in cell wall biosynthesis
MNALRSPMSRASIRGKVKNEERPRILFIAPQPFFVWRGSPIRVGFDVQALAEMGFAVDLLTLPLGEDRPIPDVRVFRVPNLYGAHQMSIGPSPIKLAFDMLLFFRALSLGLTRRYAAIHGVEDAGAIAVAVGAMTRAKVVFEKHSDPSSYRGGPWRNAVMWLYQKFEAFTIRHADAVICTGRGLAEQAKRLSPKGSVFHIPDIPSSLAEATPEGVSRARRVLSQSPDEIVVLFVGSFAPYQGIDLMFEAMAQVLRQHANVRFVVIGGSPAEIAERQKWVAARAAGDRTSFPGLVHPDQLPNYLAAADILLSPRRAGVNTPLKLLDYLKAGKAIVATDNSANRQILDENCAAFSAAEPDAYARAIGALVTDRERRNRLGENGRRLIRETYNFGEFKRRLVACYASCGCTAPEPAA